MILCPSRSRTLAASLVALVLAFCAGQAEAFDKQGLTVHGFSPDGRHFAFTQATGTPVEGEESSDTIVLDVARNRQVDGSPIRFRYNGDRDEAIDPVPLRKRSAERTAALLKAFSISSAGTILGQDATARTGETGSFESPTGQERMALAHPSLGAMTLELTTRQIPWPRHSRINSLPTATRCAEDLDKPTGPLFQLDLVRGAKRVRLYADTTIPADRNCVLAYGIVEARAQQRRDGKIALAVIVMVTTRGWEGSDRQFLAETTLLKP